ncbi:protein kinase domain-containing protein [Halorientalis salina]|uniref:protein kinase domain-containing protein n=1 Tax=Halorientalis salina TaxID=2932266 RepID=UPI0010ACF71F|nr:protein kinase [Halorientalis salina]
MVHGSDDESSVRPVFRETVADPAAGREQLSELLVLLDSDDRPTRLNAAWSLSLVAQYDPGAVERIATGLATRLGTDGEGEPTAEAELAFAYLRNRFPETVSEVLSDVAKESAVEDVRRRLGERGGSLARSDYISGGMVSRDVGRTKVPEGNESDPRSVYQNRQNDGEEPEEMKDLSELLDGRVDDLDDQRRAAARRQGREADLERAAGEAAIEDITEESRFDRLAIVAPGIDGRYTTIFRTRAVRGNSEEGIAINCFRTPDSDRERFAAEVTDALENWAAIADEDSVVSLFDWASSPAPWMATEYAVRTLYDRTDVDLSRAIRDAVTVAKTISHAHQRGVIHAGIDPYNVVYADGFMSEGDRPLVKNFGLMNVMRQYFDPSTLLDPRYAAPEYFDRSYGDIDHATDIYQLGAVVYKLLTGRPPFEGNYNEVRTGILNTDPVPPSEHDPEITNGLDEVVRKAMAKQKLTRYETVSQLVSDLRRAAE